MSAKTIESVLAENATLQEQVKTLTTERDKAREDLSIATKEDESQKASVVTLTSERDSLKTSVETLTKERDQLKASNETLAKEDKDFETRVAAGIAAGIRAHGILTMTQAGSAPGKSRTITEECLEANRKVAA